MSQYIATASIHAQAIAHIASENLTEEKAKNLALNQIKARTHAMWLTENDIDIHKNAEENASNYNLELKQLPANLDTGVLATQEYIENILYEVYSDEIKDACHNDSSTESETAIDTTIENIIRFMANDKTFARALSQKIFDGSPESDRLQQKIDETIIEVTRKYLKSI